MSPDDLRALLRDAAENAPAYRPVDVDAELPITAFRRWTVLGLVAAAFVVIAAGGLVLSRTNDNADVLPPISDSTAPSRPTSSSHPSNEASRGMSPDGVRCPAADFTVAWTGNGVGAGSMTSWFTVTNTSSKTCSVTATGPSEVEGVTADGRAQVVPVQGVGVTDYEMNPARQLGPGQSGRFAVGTGNAGACDAPLTGSYTAVRVALGASGPLVADFSDSHGDAFSPGCGAWVSGVGVVPPFSTAPCGKWIAHPTRLYQTIVRDYGEIDDCGAIDGAWVVDTDEGSTGVGAVGIHVCGGNGDCKNDVPSYLQDWTFYYVAHDKGTNERLSGVDNGKIRFVGAVGEVHFDPYTGKWDVPVTLASPSR